MGPAIRLCSLHYFKIMAVRKADGRKMWLVSPGILNLPSIIPSLGRRRLQIATNVFKTL